MLYKTIKAINQKPNQTKPNQTKPNQTKPNQTKPNSLPIIMDASMQPFTIASIKSNEFDLQTLKEIIAAAQSSVKAQKSPSRKLSPEERSELDFNPLCCHARTCKVKCHPNTNFPMYKPPAGKLVACGLIPMQCDKPIHSGSSETLCKAHADPENVSDATRCSSSGELFLGLVTNPLIENPTRHRKRDNAEKKFVWIHHTDETYDDFKTDPNTGNLLNKPVKEKKSKSPAKEKKSKSPAKEKKSKPKMSYNEIDWKEVISSDEIDTFKKEILVLYLEQHGMETKGYTKNLCKNIRDHFSSDKSEESDDSSSSSEEEDNSEKIDVIIKSVVDSEGSDNESSPASSEEDEEEEEEKEEEEEDEEIDISIQQHLKNAAAKKFPKEDDVPQKEEDEPLQDDEHPNEVDEPLQDDEQKSITVCGIEYEIEDGDFYDMKTTTNMGKIVPGAKHGVKFSDEGLLIHKTNLFADCE